MAEGVSDHSLKGTDEVWKLAGRVRNPQLRQVLVDLRTVGQHLSPRKRSRSEREDTGGVSVLRNDHQPNRHQASEQFAPSPSRGCRRRIGPLQEGFPPAAAAVYEWPDVIAQTPAAAVVQTTNSARRG
jgi:hypothetical protein